MTASPSPHSPIHRAAVWLAIGNADRRKAILPQIKAQFSLTTAEAIEAIRESRLVLARAH